ncbi:hypothetical protein PT974_01432 [Cladobotryum mycophilum]|uniref:Uncharacterized protein n=1 Tax=Cladobotryum mycophilum TaxID=491253 RepID=A0ABR0T4S2_9HYPO
MNDGSSLKNRRNKRTSSTISARDLLPPARMETRSVTLREDLSTVGRRNGNAATATMAGSASGWMKAVLTATDVVVFIAAIL